MTNDYECIEYKSPDLQKEIEEIKLVKSAIRIDEKVYTGWRHSEIFLFIRDSGVTQCRTEEQGFIDQDNAFYRRKSCSIIAFRNKQVVEFKNTLTSEDLWDRHGKPWSIDNPKD